MVLLVGRVYLPTGPRNQGCLLHFVGYNFGNFVLKLCDKDNWTLLEFKLVLLAGFLKPFLKGKILRSSERGVNSILTTILRF